MGRMNEGFASDQLKQKITEYKKRQKEGLVETYAEATGEKIEEGNLGLSKEMVAAGAVDRRSTLMDELAFLKSEQSRRIETE